MGKLLLGDLKNLKTAVTGHDIKLVGLPLKAERETDELVSATNEAPKTIEPLKIENSEENLHDGRQKGSHDDDQSSPNIYQKFEVFSSENCEEDLDNERPEIRETKEQCSQKLDKKRKSSQMEAIIGTGSRKNSKMKEKCSRKKDQEREYLQNENDEVDNSTNDLNLLEDGSFEVESTGNEEKESISPAVNVSKGVK